MSDLVERLRAFTVDFGMSAHHPEICSEAADEIERLRVFVDRVASSSNAGHDTVSLLLELGKLGRVATAIRARGAE